MPSVIPSGYVYWDRFGYVRESDKTGPYTISSSGDAALIGNGSALDLNFLSGTLDPRITFTRASTATFIGSDGLIQTAASGVPRFEYDPVTLAPDGMLIEEARTNLVLNSTINGANLATQSVTVTAQAYTLSFYGTGTVTLSGASTAGPLVGSGAYPTRSTLTFTPSAGSLTLTVTGTVQFTNLEAGTIATSYIPTAGAAATRAAETALLGGTGFSGFYNTLEGSIVVEGILPPSLVGTHTYASIDSGPGNRIQLQSTQPAGTNCGIEAASVGQFFDLYAGTANLGALNKLAIGYSVGSAFVATNGAQRRNTLSGITIPTAVNRLSIGIDRSGGSRLNGAIRRIRYWNKRLPNATLQALTA